MMVRKENPDKEYLDRDDYLRISKDIVRLLSQNCATYRDAERITEYVIDTMRAQKVQEPID